MPNSHLDCHILLCAWLERLAKIGSCEWNGTLSPILFSLRWHEQQLPQLITTILHCVTNSHHPAISVIPRLSITPALSSENLQTWRESVDSIFSSYSTYHDIAESKRLREAQEAAAAILDSLSAEELESTLTLRRAKSRKQYVTNSLQFHENQPAVTLVNKVIAKPYDFELLTLQQVKAFCLDFLPENGHENYNDKQEIVQLLDAAILDRVGMVQLLGCATSEQLQDAVTIKAKYQSTIEGKVYTTSSNPKITAAINAHNQAAIGIGSKQETVFNSEPQPGDFRHRLGYEAALRLWNRTKSQSKEISL